VVSKPLLKRKAVQVPRPITRIRRGFVSEKALGVEEIHNVVIECKMGT
jgi:hypothetical protein